MMMACGCVESSHIEMLMEPCDGDCDRLRTGHHEHRLSLPTGYYSVAEEG